MAHRYFTARDGRCWEVWDVFPEMVRQPTYSPQRMGDRRSPDPVLLHKGPERRTGERRRLRSPPPTFILHGLERGWLVFVSGSLKKRLAPPPPEWDSLPDEALAGLLARAR
jgi:hypothetical protein